MIDEPGDWRAFPPQLVFGIRRSRVIGDAERFARSDGRAQGGELPGEVRQ